MARHGLAEEVVWHLLAGRVAHHRAYGVHVTGTDGRLEKQDTMITRAFRCVQFHVSMHTTNDTTRHDEPPADKLGRPGSHVMAPDNYIAAVEYAPNTCCSNSALSHARVARVPQHTPTALGRLAPVSSHPSCFKCQPSSSHNGRGRAEPRNVAQMVESTRSSSSSKGLKQGLVVVCGGALAGLHTENSSIVVVWLNTPVLQSAST